MKNVLRISADNNSYVDNRKSDKMPDNTQSMIFTLYGDYIRHYGNKIWIGSLIQLLDAFGHNEQAVRVAMSRMYKNGWVQSERIGNKSYYFLTDQGIKRIDEAGKRIFRVRPHSWDGKWRILIYSIPEDKRHLRDELRKELIWSGFGSFTNSVWITPNDLEEEVRLIIAKYDIGEYVDFFISEYLGPHPVESIVRKSWTLELTDEQYKQFIKNYSEKYIIHQSMLQKGQLTDAECFVARTYLVHEYRKSLFVDPGLPKELLPEVWSGSPAAMLFRQYYELLAEPASRFFEQIFEKDNELRYKDKQYDAYAHPYISE